MIEYGLAYFDRKICYVYGLAYCYRPIRYCSLFWQISKLILIDQYFSVWSSLPRKASDAKYLTSKSESSQSLLMHGFTWDVWQDEFNLGPMIVKHLAMLNRTLGTPSPAKFRTVGSIKRSVISGPHASARTWNPMEIWSISTSKYSCLQPQSSKISKALLR